MPDDNADDRRDPISDPAAVLLLGGLGGFVLGQATADDRGGGGRDHGRFADHRR